LTTENIIIGVRRLYILCWRHVTRIHKVTNLRSLGTDNGMEWKENKKPTCR